MESQGVSSSSRRTAGGGNGRLDRSSSSMQGVFIAKVGDDKDGVAPKCHCGVFAILYLSLPCPKRTTLRRGCDRKRGSKPPLSDLVRQGETMGSSRERWSASNRDGERDGGDGEGWSVTKRSSESASALKKKSNSLPPNANAPAPHCNFFAWLDEYVASYGAVMSKAVYPGCGEQVEGQQCGAAQFDLKCKELNDR
ncbi:hypothetical protein PIB30_096816, partial [Stylosanthes scabra]|nr:hypothetical protein [Stylosanthes scabra]